MFIVPESVPAYFPPTSMQAAQLPGITKSLKKLEKPMANIANVASGSEFETSDIPAAPTKPKTNARYCCPFCTLCKTTLAGSAPVLSTTLPFV